MYDSIWTYVFCSNSYMISMISVIFAQKLSFFFSEFPFSFYTRPKGIRRIKNPVKKKYVFFFQFQTPWFFIRDQWNKFTMMQVKHLPRALLITPEALFFPKVWLVCAMFALCKLVLYPEVIAPFWEKYSLLPEGELKEGIQALAASVDFPLCKVYIVAGAKRSSENEVKLYGFNKNKKIVLFDTLVKGFNKPVDGEEDRECENDEVVAVIAHELGHWKYGHKIKKLLLPQVRRETIKGECNILVSIKTISRFP